MMKTFCFLFTVLVYVNAEAQYVFNRGYDVDSSNDFAHAVMQTLDGKYLILGDPTPSAVYLMKLYQNGDTQWVKHFDFSFNAADIASSAIQLADSSYIMCGTTKDTFGIKPDVMLLKVDKNGDSLWLKRYGDTDLQNDYGQAVIQPDDSSFLILALTWDSLGGTIEENALLIKTDTAGNEIWRKRYGGSKSDLPRENTLIKTKDGGYAFSGATKSYNVTYQIWLMKLDVNGDSLWQRTYSLGTDDGANGLIETLDGGFIMVGFTEEVIPSKADAYIVKTDKDGNKQWEKIYGRPGQTDTYVSIVQLNDSSYVIAGQQYNAANTDIDGWLMKINSKGDSIWSRNYSMYGGNNNDYLLDLKATNDEGFIMCGWVTNYGQPTAQDMWLVKTDCEGNETFWDSTRCFPVSILEFPASSLEFQVFPNPFSYTAIISIEYLVFSKKQDLQFTIYDLLGRKVKQSTINNQQSTISRDNLPSGIYFYQITSDRKSIASGKLIIQ